MATFVSLGDVHDAREWLGSAGREVWRTFFLNPAAGSREPQAFLIEYGPGVVLQTHFHDVDEYQVVLEGQGTLGRHALAPHTVHHARAWTPYGPIVAGPTGLSFLTLRAQRDSSGPRKLPQQQPALDAVPARMPWQAAELVSLPPAYESFSRRSLQRIADGRGPLADVVVMPPDSIHDVSGLDETGGAFIALLRGSLRVSAGSCRAPAVAFAATDEGTVKLVSGADGAAVLVLRFAAHDAGVARRDAPNEPAVWRCSVCGSTYDERMGDPTADVPHGTPWTALPDDWRCPDCDAPRAAFELSGGRTP